MWAKNEKLKAEWTMSKELLSNKLIKDLETKSKELKEAQEAFSRFNSERAALTSNHQDLKVQVESLQRTLKKANNEDGVHAAAKMAHREDMTCLKIRGQSI